MALRNAVVIGGAGFIGSHLARKLSKNQYVVTVYDDLSNGSGLSNLPKEIRFVKGNILNVKKLQTVCKKADVVFNLAVKPLAMSFDKPEEVVKINDYGAYLVAKICTDLKCKLIHISSSEAYGSAIEIPMKESHPLFPSTVYASSKAAAEHYVRGMEKMDGLKAVIIRPFNSYGEFMRNDDYGAVFTKFLQRLSTKKHPIIFGTGKQTRDFTYVDDTCNGMMLADSNEKAIGDTFNIGQGKETTILRIAKIMIKKYNQITSKEISNQIIFAKPRPGDVKRHLADISHARKVLGYKPEVTLEEGIEKLIRWGITNFK